MKKLISILLALILAASCCVIAASAEDTADEHPKFSPALVQKLNTLTQGEQLDLLVCFTDEVKSIDQMPSWPEHGASSEYSEYLRDANTAIIQAIFVDRLADIERTYTDVYLPGCTLISRLDPSLLPVLEASDHVKSIDVYDPRGGFCGPYNKYDFQLLTVSGIFSPDDYVSVIVSNASPILAVDDMPSWKEGKAGSVADAQAMIAAARSEYSAYLDQVTAQFITEAFDGIDAVVFSGSFGFMVFAAVKNSDLTTLASRSCVSDICYNENPIMEPDIIDEPDPVPAPDIMDYQQKFCEQYELESIDKAIFEALIYHHYNRDDKTCACDWVLVYSLFEGGYPDALYDGIVGGRKLSAAQLNWYPFQFGFGIYDAEQDRYFDLAEVNFDDYPDLYEVWQNFDFNSGSYGVYENSPDFHINPGDADGDGDVTIMDATKIQRLSADLCTKYEVDMLSADVDGDDDVTILDATRIQRYKADLCDLDGTPIENPDDDYEVGTLLVKVSTGEPRSIARARNTVLSLMDSYGIEAIGLVASTETSATFKVDFAEKSAEHDRLAIAALKNSGDVISAAPYRGEFSRYEPDGFAPGRVIVSGTGYGELLKDFEIEETRLLTPGSGRAVYVIIFKEKTKEIVWRALEILEICPTIEYADPDFYYYVDEC